MLHSQIVNAISPYKDDVIVCLETSADIQLLSSGTVYEDLFRVFSTHDIKDSALTVEVISEEDFQAKEIVVVSGLSCTSPVQTVIDLLEYEDVVDWQTLVEALSDYYYEHDCSFSGLESLLTGRQLDALNKWAQDAIECHEEG